MKYFVTVPGPNLVGSFETREQLEDFCHLIPQQVLCSEHEDDAADQLVKDLIAGGWNDIRVS